VRKLYKLNLRDDQVCFSINTEACCGETITEPARFKLEIHKDSILDTSALITYSNLDEGADGQLCWTIDENMRNLCAGRYIARFILDDCIELDDIKLKWGSVPRITDVTATKAEDQSVDPMPATCCPDCGQTESEGYDCNQCCSRCDCPPTFEDPVALLKRDC